MTNPTISVTRRVAGWFRSGDGASQSSFGGSFAQHRVIPTPRHPPRPRSSRKPPIDLPVGDLEALEGFDMAQDLAAYREAKAADDGGRATLDELRRGAAQWPIGSCSPRQRPARSTRSRGGSAIGSSAPSKTSSMIPGHTLRKSLSDRQRGGSASATTR